MKHFLQHALAALVIVAVPFLAKAGDTDKVVMTIDGNDIYLSEFSYMYHKNCGDTNIETARDFATSFALFKMKVYEAEAVGYDTLPTFKSELAEYYRTIDSNDENLRREYRDGMLLFEITRSKVWHPSCLTGDRLKEHFEANRGKFSWKEPRAKGWVLYSNDENLAKAACEYLNSNGCETLYDIRKDLKDRFGSQVTAGKFIVRRGLNPMVDALVFDGAASYCPDNGWKVAVAYNFRVIDTPEEWQDVKGELTEDFQNTLAENWERELWATHKVKFNYDVIDKEK